MAWTFLSRQVLAGAALFVAGGRSHTSAAQTNTKKLSKIDFRRYVVSTTNLSQREWDHYASLKNIGVHFQAKAWAHHKYSLEWMERFRAQTLGKGEVLLGMDNHGPQKTPLVRAFMSAMGIVPAYTPADCTDCVSPVDHHVGKPSRPK